MEITLDMGISFLLGITIGSIVVNFYWIKKTQKSTGDNSPNVMGDRNKVN